MKEEAALGEGAASEQVIAATVSSIALVGEISRQIGYESAMFAILEAGRTLSAEAARSIYVHPRIAELTEIRKPDYTPCPARCRSCSRCICYEAWHRRGRRPYLGVQQEHEVVGNQMPDTKHLKSHLRHMTHSAGISAMAQVKSHLSGTRQVGP